MLEQGVKPAPPTEAGSSRERSETGLKAKGGMPVEEDEA